MKITYYRITEDAHLAATPAEAFLDSWKRGKGQYWIDISAYQPEELKGWLSKLKLSELAIKCCVEPTFTSRVVPLDDAVFFEFPVYAAPSVRNPKAQYISFLCLRNLVITTCADPCTKGPLPDEVLKVEMTLAKATTSALVGVLLAGESAGVAQLVDGLKAAVFERDERMDRDPDSVDADDIREQKRRLRVYDMIVSGQVESLEILHTVEAPFLNLGDSETHFQFAAANASAASQAAARLDKAVADLSQRFDARQQAKTDHRLAVLTTLSAIFTPLTFLAGVYGMNFKNMPELRSRWGYPLLLGSMLLIGGGIFRYFKTHGWLDSDAGT